MVTYVTIIVIRLYDIEKVIKKNIRYNIIKTILGYSPIAVLISLKEWKTAITLVGQRYKSTKDRQDYKMELEITYRRRELSMDIGKVKDNYDKDKKPVIY